MTCYAVHLGDCAGGLSKEHYVSESVLEIAGTAVQVTGFPWQPGGETAQIGTASLAAKILCKHHNEQLSPLDSVAKVFLSGLKASFQRHPRIGCRIARIKLPVAPSSFGYSKFSADYCHFGRSLSRTRGSTFFSSGIPGPPKPGCTFSELLGLLAGTLHLSGYVGYGYRGPEPNCRSEVRDRRTRAASRLRHT